MLLRTGIMDGVNPTEPDVSRIPWGAYHNLFVMLLVVAVSLWAVKVGTQLFTVISLGRSLTTSRPLQLHNMSIYMEDLKLIIRQHFNQILRMRRTVPSRPTSRYEMMAHVKPETLVAVEHSDRVGIEFVVDCLASCTVRLYWGVNDSALQAFFVQHQGLAEHNTPGSPTAASQRPSSPLPGSPTASTGSPMAFFFGAGQADDPTEMENRELFFHTDCNFVSEPLRMAKGMDQPYRTPVTSMIRQTDLSFDIAKPWPDNGDGTPIPLVVAVTSSPRSSEERRLNAGAIDSHSQVTLVRFKREEAGARALKAEVAQQIIFGDDGAHRIQGIFGFEGDRDEETEVWDCQICYDRPKSVLLLPCRHCSVCEFCLRSLRDERCPMCRATFSSYLLLPLSRETAPNAAAGALPEEAGQSFAAPAGF